MFSMLYTAASPAKGADFTELPLVLWLSGGPGASSTVFGNFQGIGPRSISGDARNGSWNAEASLLFVDYPVGVGLSHVDNASVPLSQYNEEIAADLVSFLKQFLTFYPHFQSTDLHIFGEGYGGKIAAHFAYAIATEQLKCNLVSVSLKDTFVGPLGNLQALAASLRYAKRIDGEKYKEIENIIRNRASYGAALGWAVDQAVNSLHVNSLPQDNSIVLDRPRTLDKEWEGFINNRKNPNLTIQPFSLPVYEELIESQAVEEPVGHMLNRIFKKTHVHVSIFTNAKEIPLPSYRIRDWYIKGETTEHGLPVFQKRARDSGSVRCDVYGQLSLCLYDDTGMDMLRNVLQ